MAAAGWREHPEALAELGAAASWLPDRMRDKFADAVLAAKEDIAAMPGAWPKVSYWVEPPTVRRRGVKPYRVAVVYLVRRGEVRVIAYAHEAREPGYWRHWVAA